MRLGIFSSKVVATNANEALIAGRGCEANLSAAGLRPENPTDFQYYATIENMKSADHLMYASRCYRQDQADESKTDACSLLTKTALPYQLDTNASCPFHPEICKQATGNFRLETGFLDSYKDFGMNKGPRFTLKLTHHCAPVVTEGYRRFQDDPLRPGLKIMRYDYGLPGSPYRTWVDVPLNITNSETAQFYSDYSVL